jgi:Ca2+-binding RTX toxin-like protein
MRARRWSKTPRVLSVSAAAVLGMALTQAPLGNAGAAPTPTCRGEVATIFVPGTANSATAVNGTSGDDVIVTGKGDDRVEGKGGRDIICTRAGNDIIRGGPGDDRMGGGPGVDRLSGKRGLDRANGGTGTKDRCAAEQERRCEGNFGK